MGNIKVRKKIEAYITAILDKLDTTGQSSAMYNFKGMTDKDFDTFMKALKDKTTMLFVTMPNLKSGISMNRLFEIAAEYGVEMFQRLHMTDATTGRSYLTPQKYMIADLPVRRVKQYLFNKISLPESDSRTNVITGQVIPPDKGAAISNIEVQILASKGLDKSLVELVKVRGGDLRAWNQFKNQLEEEGRSSLAETDLSSRPRSVITAGTYLNGLMLDHNL